MDNILQFIINLQDKFSEPLHKVSQNSQLAQNQLKKLTDSQLKLQQSMNTGASSMKQMRDQIQKLQQTKELLPSTAENQIRRINGEINKLEGNINRLDHISGTSRFKKWGQDAINNLPFGNFITNPLVMAGTALTYGFTKGYERMEEHAQAEAQVRASLTSTRGAAGVSMGDVQNSAKSIDETSRYSMEEIMKMQSVLLTFPGVNKKIFSQTSQIITDLSAKMGQDLQSSAVEVGKALQDPQKGVMALRRIGVNFNEAQQKYIDTLVESGHKAQAQMIILNELQNEFAGSAKAAFDADPLAQYHKSLEELQRGMGKIAFEALKVLVPVFESVIKGIKGVVHWIDENKRSIGLLITIMGAMVMTYQIYAKWEAIAQLWAKKDILIKGIQTVVTGGLTAAMEALNAAFVSSPIGWIVLGIGALAGGIYYLCTRTKEAKKEQDGLNDAFKDATNISANLLKIHQKAANDISDRIAKAQVFLDIIKDTTKSHKEQAKALHDLVSLNKDHFGGLKTVEQAYKDGDTALMKYTQDMYKHAEAMAAVEVAKDAIKKGIEEKLGYAEHVKDIKFLRWNGRVTNIVNDDMRKGWIEQRNSEIDSRIANQFKSALYPLFKNDKYAMKIFKTADIIGGSPGDGNDDGSGSDTASGIAGSGPRVISIKGVTMKLAEKMEVMAMDGKKFLKDMEPMMEDFWLRVLNSGASVQ